MVQKDRSRVNGHVAVQFELPASLWADQVWVVGDFNDWNPKAMPMRQKRDGTWSATVDLPANRCFQFLYLVDGAWRPDPSADGLVPSNCGIDKSVVDTATVTYWQ